MLSAISLGASCAAPVNGQCADIHNCYYQGPQMCRLPTGNDVKSSLTAVGQCISMDTPSEATFVAPCSADVIAREAASPSPDPSAPSSSKSWMWWVGGAVVLVGVGVGVYAITR